MIPPHYFLESGVKSHANLCPHLSCLHSLHCAQARGQSGAAQKLQPDAAELKEARAQPHLGRSWLITTGLPRCGCDVTLVTDSPSGSGVLVLTQITANLLRTAEERKEREGGRRKEGKDRNQIIFRSTSLTRLHLA